ncbi:hypothetical protein V6N13_094724 [Hibiscus sabdariffa]
MNLKFISWNVQGCGNWRFLPTARQVLRDYKPDLVVFVEPRISGRKADSVIASLGFPNSHRVEAAGFSGGIWLAWYDSVSVEIIANHFQFIHCRITDKISRRSVYATAIYASPSSAGRKFLWPHLRRLAGSIRSPWVIFGDFNATVHSDDRKRCLQAPCKAFQNFLLDYGLRDMGYQGPKYTWSRGLAQARLDRFICNSYWDEEYPTSVVSHLLQLRSDHRPIFLEVGHSRPPPMFHQFRYFSGWLAHEDFNRMVLDNWCPKITMTETLLHFSKATDVWNKFVFGYIGRKKRRLMARLRGIQKFLCTRPSRFLSSLESDLLIELENILDQEELLWKQKSRSDWISNGDRNTRYFHRRAVSRKQKNHIVSLKLSDGEWCDDSRLLKQEAVNFFSSLFSCPEGPVPTFPIHGAFPPIDADLMSSLDSSPSVHEIYDALMAMAPLKSPVDDASQAGLP